MEPEVFSLSCPEVFVNWYLFQTSVPVTVHLSERLLQAGGGAGSVASAGGAGPVMAVFACALAALALLVCALLGYIYRV